MSRRTLVSSLPKTRCEGFMHRPPITCRMTFHAAEIGVHWKMVTKSNTMSHARQRLPRSSTQRLKDWTGKMRR